MIRTKLLPKLLLAAALGLIASGGAAIAEGRKTLGWGQMVVNDSLGDFYDRWRTGSYSVSTVRGAGWSGALPERFGDLLEFRARGEAIAPAGLRFRAPTDRRYAGILSFGVHSHFERAGWENTVGLDVVVLGPQTGVSEVHGWIHDLIGLSPPIVASTQISNQIRPTLVLETARTFRLGSNSSLRPFIEAQAGVETFVRVGGDLTIGKMAEGSLLVREQVTGLRYPTVRNDQPSGLSFVVGADIARVFDSAYFPKGDIATVSDTRARARVGVHWARENLEIFYGLTWLGREFDTQPDSQYVGGLSVKFRF